LGVEFGGFHLPIPPEVLAARPALGAFADRPVVLGIRPEDMEDASLVSDAPAERRIRATVELREALGSDVVVHFTIAAPPALTDDVRELVIDVGQEALQKMEEKVRGGESNVVARLNPRTRAQTGETIELVVDATRLHFFDPDTGAGIYGQPEG
jgi:multiple sugar transport system ATP-binding protein